MHNTKRPLGLQPDDALIVVDVQIDFLPGGALGVPEAGQVVAVLNRYLRNFAQLQLPIFATRDWHPADHCSFRAAGGPWPPHCVADTSGARFAPGLILPPQTQVISKATTRDKDAYSGFEDTDLIDRLRLTGTKRVFVGGLATDYCVLHTVRDALKAGLTTILLKDAIRAVNAQPGDGEAAIAQMQRLGAEITKFEE